MRRRRLALRQIAETTQDVSDIDGDDSDAQQRQQSAEAPTFNLLTVTTGAGVASTAILLSDDDVDDATLLQHERSARPSPMKSAATKPIQSTNGDAGEEEATVASSSSSIFHLYQEGLAPDQVLQLAFTRRRVRTSSTLRDCARVVAAAVHGAHLVYGDCDRRHLAHRARRIRNLAMTLCCLFRPSASGTCYRQPT